MSEYRINQRRPISYATVSAGDSSDEEDSVESYDLRNQIQAFKDKPNRVREVAVNENTVLSFITHAVGIYLLYSPPVQTRYYKLKKLKLPNDSPFASSQDRANDIKSKIEDLKKNDQLISTMRIEYAIGVNYSAILNEMLSKIADDKVSYARAYYKGEARSYLGCDELFRENGVDPRRLKEPQEIKMFNQLFQPFSRPKRRFLNSPVIDLSAVTEEDFVFQHLAHIRLHNRSEKAHLVNRTTCPDTKWRISNASGTESDLVVALDNENDSFHSNCRNEVVLFDGFTSIASYTMIFCNANIQEQILLKYRLNIRKAQQRAYLTRDTVRVWYLLFGSEVKRNPAHLVHVNMAFDLVEAGRVEWGSVVKKIPMCASSALVKQHAMKLNEVFRDFMPHKYLYQIESDYDLGDLVEREAAIVKEWLELKLGRAVAGYLVSRCASDNDAVRVIWDVILGSFDVWGLKQLK
jgi:hypothetical protein